MVLHVEKSAQGLVEVRLARAAQHNAFDDALITALREAFQDIATHEDVRAVHLWGEGPSFCAGADIHTMRAAGEMDMAENQAAAQAMSDMFAAIYDCPVPVIAHVHGAVYGGGLGLVAAADMVVAESATRFRLSEVRIGLSPATIAPFVLRAIGARHAVRYFTTAELFDAVTARDMGLVHHVAADGEAARAQVVHWWEALKSAGPQAVRASKALVRDLAGQPITPALRTDTAKRIALRRAHDEGREGLAAFLEKRRPAWDMDA